MNNDYFIKQAQEIITEYNLTKSKAKYLDLSDLSEELLTRLITKSKSFVVRVVGEKSEYYKDIISALTQKNLGLGTNLSHVIGSIIALKEDLENDYLKSYSELLHSEIFSDYIEISRHLLENGYKDSSAVIIGSTLESHLRKLCLKHNVEIELDKGNGKISYKNSERMNTDLTKEEAYSLANQKQITAWLAIRNNSAHGKYDEYTESEVKLMIMGVENFILSNPA
ncbi:hypothetical protein [Flavobacterium sp. 245]|uniref:hypothetical protein n=1 Tax=Flavobacterium sp. 245 TaxID=2512115 RepID=UPI00105C63A5|nr:hypothetical protein [Flavobacterium sp. 245]TDP00307.1 hypothetical protein EV145_106202 [Flavobacterium sp. 245]